MWSEHCSYKVSRVHLKKLPTRSKLVVQGPGENAGIIDIGDGWACAFKIESHNHPIVHRAVSGRGHRRRRNPARHLHHGRAAGRGDGFAALRADSPSEHGPPEQRRSHKNHSIVEGVVSGIAHYGNCFGVPTLGGETMFEPCYSRQSAGECLRAGAGPARPDFLRQGGGRGQSRDLRRREDRTRRHSRRDHGQRRVQRRVRSRSGPTCRWAIRSWRSCCSKPASKPCRPAPIVGIQDMGAAGLTCSTCEMGARGDVGIEIELDLVPQRETGMTPYEIMLSESQERMLLVAEKGREQEVFASSRSGDWTRSKSAASPRRQAARAASRRGCRRNSQRGAHRRCAALQASAGALGAAGRRARCRAHQARPRLPISLPI